jgi:hypothetical protein
MHNIRQDHMEEITWDKHWKNFISWGMEVGVWKEETKFIERDGIRHYFDAPHIIDLRGWKEEATKFIICLYNRNHLWLEYPFKITGGLIQYRIIGLQHGGVSIPKAPNLAE